MPRRAFKLFSNKENEHKTCIEALLMKKDIKVHGAYFEVDKQGFLINPASLPDPSSDWFAVVNYITENLKALFGNNLHSIYLRGSVAASCAETAMSDLDMFVLLFSKQEIYWEHISESEEWERYCLQHFPVFHKLDLYKTAYKANIQNAYPNLASVIKTQSICVYGTDVSLAISPYKASHIKPLHLKWLRKDLDHFYESYCDLDACSAIMKILLRAAFDLVMEKDGRYTNSLYFCWRSFSEHYPEKENHFRQALDWYLNPTTNKKILVAYLKEHGEWLYTEACRLQIIETDKLV